MCHILTNSRRCVYILLYTLCICICLYEYECIYICRYTYICMNTYMFMMERSKLFCSSQYQEMCGVLIDILSCYLILIDNTLRMYICMYTYECMYICMYTYVYIHVNDGKVPDYSAAASDRRYVVS